MNIGNKMFTYIGLHTDLTQSMIDQYRNSLIFIGDEKQIFNPLTNAYVGIGQTSYNNLLQAIELNSNKVDGLDTHIHHNVVNSIFAQYSPDELYNLMQSSQTGEVTINNIRIGSGNYKTALRANNDVVLKGNNDYDPATPSTYGTSGIQVNIKHNGTYMYGVDEYGFTYSYYANGYDELIIDDTNTWSYITTTTTYLMNYSTQVAIKQANRVYKNLLGIPDEVYIEKELSEAFLFNTQTNKIETIKNQPVFVKRKDGITFSNVKVANTDDGHYIIYINNDNKALYTNYPNNIIPSNTTFTDENGTTVNISTCYTSDELENILGDSGGYETSLETGHENLNVPVWYHVDYEKTAYSNIDITDGINTIKEVAYILDVLTDGDDDDSINLVYNIAWNHDNIVDLLNWKQNIGQSAVRSFQAESNNNLLTVTYYSSDLWNDTEKITGDIKLDINLRLAYTYYDDNNEKHAAYIQSNHNPVPTYWITSGDKTNGNNYLKINNSTYEDLLSDIGAYYSYKGINDFILEVYKYDSQNNVYTFHTNINVSNGNYLNSFNNLKNSDEYYLYWPYKQYEYNVETGLTTVDWVTSYVAWGTKDIYDMINNIHVDSDIKSYINNYLNYNNTAKTGQYVSNVTETAGVISVEYTYLPLSYIIENTEFYTNDMFLRITYEEAQTIRANYLNGSSSQILYKSTDDINYTDTTGEALNSNTNYYIKITQNSFTAVEGGTPVTDLIENARNTNYFEKKESGQVIQYIPIDINRSLSDINGLLYDNATVAPNTIYYLNGSNSRIKYFDTRSVLASDGSTSMFITSYITYLAAASSTNSGLTDAWDVRQTIEAMFDWIDLRTNKIIS